MGEKGKRNKKTGINTMPNSHMQNINVGDKRTTSNTIGVGGVEVVKKHEYVSIPMDWWSMICTCTPIQILIIIIIINILIIRIQTKQKLQNKMDPKMSVPKIRQIRPP